MDYRFVFLLVVFNSTVCIAQMDSLSISLKGKECCNKFGIMELTVESIDSALFEMDSDDLRTGYYSKVRNTCKNDFGKLYYYVFKRDTTAQWNSGSHWYGLDERTFSKKLKKEHTLQLPLHQAFILDPGHYNLFAVYHSRKYNKCIKSNVILFSVTK